MIDPTSIVAPFAKKLGENIADRVSNSFSATGLEKKASVADDTELEQLRAENEQLRTYVFLMLDLLKKEVKAGEDAGNGEA